MKMMNDKEVADLTLPELIEALCRLAEEIEIRAMQLSGEPADGKEEQ